MDTLRSIEGKTTPVIQRVSPRTIPGILTGSNKGAIDWGWQSFVAYGCYNHVIVVDTKNFKVFQTLEKHKSEVFKVKWAKETYYHDKLHPYTLKLASADTTGSLVIWDVKEGKAKSAFSEGGKPISEMEWLSGKDTCQNLLVALHPPYSVVVWNTETGTKIWKKSYTEVLMTFAFDPFTENNMAFLASDCILFVDDFSINKIPSSNGRKFYISNPSTAGSQQSINASNSSLSGDDRPRPLSRSILPRRMRFLVKADSKCSSDDGVTLNECLQLSYHRSYRNHLLLLYPREVLILDLEINQTVGIVSIEQNGSAMMQLYSCWQRDVFLILHETGSVSFRMRHRGHLIMAAATPSEAGDAGYSSSDTNLEVTYDLHCQSDALRLTKHAKIIGMSVCPLSESKVALLVSDGRMLFLELAIFRKMFSTQKDAALSLAPHLSRLFKRTILPKLQSANISEKICTFPCKVSHPANVLSDNIGPSLYPRELQLKDTQDMAKFRIFLTGSTSVLAAPPHVIRMCPPVTFRNWTMYRPLMAVGNAGGSVQVLNMATGVVEREFSMHTSPVRGIEWVGLTSFMSYAHPNMISNLGQVRNELVLTDVQSGRTKALRTDRTEESPIEMIRVSYLRQYIIIAFKEDPFELWDLRLLTLLRIMPKNFPSITALEWSPGHYRKHHTSQDGTDRINESNISNTESITENHMASKSLIYTKEHFVFTDTNGQLYHFCVEGNVVRDGSTVPADAGMGSITSIAWKGDHIVLGDVDGNLNVWNLKGKVSKGIPTHRGWIKKIRFGPGRGNMKILVLYNDGVDLWDVKDVMIIHQIRCPREMPKVQDIDWVGSDRPAFATSDGCVRVTDISLKLSSSQIQDYQPSDFLFSPHILSPNIALYLKSFLQHQPEEEKFNLDTGQQDNYDISLAEKQLESLSSQLREFLKDCPFGTAERALHISRLFGDEESCHFWTIALHFLKEEYLHRLKCERGEVSQYDSSSDHHISQLIQSDIPIFQCRNNFSILECFIDQPLDTGYDIYCDNETYKKLQLDRVALHVYKRSTHSQTQHCAENLLLLGQTEKAVQLLLETESNNENFYVDCLRACLIATVQSSGTSQSIIKLVSTNLIASGNILEGVQLLCLIEKGMDACRYLQGSGRWDQAVWLAKATLAQKECQEIMKRWADHLCSATVNQKNKGLLVLISMHQFWKVIDLLHSFEMTERAALFLQSCMEFGIISRAEMYSSKIDEIFLDYAKYLFSLKNQASAIQYCKLVPEIGDDLREQIQLLESS